MMLARVADSLYWIGRYLERAEHFSRLADVMLNATLDRSDAAAQTAYIALSAVGDPDMARAARTYEAAKSLVLDREDPNSVVISLSLARENARQVRDQITTETWERLNLLYLKVTSDTASAAFESGSSAFLHDTIADLHLFKGAADATMSHGEGWRFLMLGAYLERAQLIARLLEVCFGSHGEGWRFLMLGAYLERAQLIARLLEVCFGDRRSARVTDRIALMNLLRMGCALEPYLRRYTAEIEPRHILEFLVFDEEFPRSIRFATTRIEEHLVGVSRHVASGGLATPERLAGRLKARLQYADVDELESVGASALLATVISECAGIHNAVFDTFVAYSLEMKLPA